METTFLTNVKLDEKKRSKIVSLALPDEPILFAIVGEISSSARYGSFVLLGTRTHLFTHDFDTDQTSEPLQLSQIEKIFNKRMYGNGLMRAKLCDGRQVDLFRFNFTVTALCDAVVNYVTDVNGGTSPEEALEAVEATYQKLLSVCPKCGRTETADRPFERIRRITGYLVGGLDRFNNAKRAEERDRVKHSVSVTEEM